MIQYDLKNTNILLTGASDGIGRGLADFLMRMGARVAVHYNTNKRAADQLIKKYGNGSEAFQADLSQETATRALFQSVVSTFKRLDVIILNAGVFLPHSTELSTDAWLSVWKRTLDINLHSVGILTKLGIDHFKKHRQGRFIYMGSRAAFRGETEEYLAYAASKGGITSLSRSVARSFGKEGIKSFVVAPGFTRTPMADSFIAVHGEALVLNEIALNELTEPKDLAPLVGLLCSGGMDHATGATIDVNAGSHIR